MAEAFANYDQQTMIDRWNLAWNDRYLFINMLGRLYRIDRVTGLVEWSDDDFQSVCEANHNEAMTIYDFLGNTACDATIAEEFVQLRSLAPFQGSAPTLGGDFFDREAKMFDKQERELAAACESLGGVAEGKGDVAYRLELFEGFPVLFQFWCSDEEFPAVIQVLFDRCALKFMHYETLWYASSVVVERITERMTVQPTR